MLTEGIYDSIPMHEYLADPCEEPSFTSSAAISIVQRSALHAWSDNRRLNPQAEADDTTATDIGSAAHAMFLEGDESPIVEIDAEDYRTKNARQSRDEAHAEGKIPLLTKHIDKAKRVVDATRKAVAACDDLKWLVDPDEEKAIESTIVWQEGRTWCRARPDAIDQEQTIVVNYKTTATCGEPDAFGNGYLIRGGYHIQAYHHLRGIEKVIGKLASYIWIVQETEPPFATSFIGMSGSLLKLAEYQWHHALAVWKQCIEIGKWPGYPTKVCWLDAPLWYTQKWCMRPDVPIDEVEAIAGGALR